MKHFLLRNLSVIILIVLTIATVVIGYLYFSNQEIANETKLGNALGGLFAGLIIAVIQHGISLDEKRKLDLIKSLSVKNVLYNRSDKDYYRKFIDSAKFEIKIMGVTAIRLLEDFANMDSTSSGDKVLVSALTRNVKVKILLPNKNKLVISNAQNFDAAKEKMEKIKQLYQSGFDYKYFDHDPAHSIFNVDNETIIGPVIPDISSKDTPGIHVQNSSQYAKIYLQYFDNEWGKAVNL